MDFIEYTALDGTPWRVEEGRGLAALFELGGDGVDIRVALAAWHEALGTQGITWEILCRLYAVNPAFGEDDVEKLSPWPPERVATHVGLRTQEIEGQVNEARTFWNRKRKDAGRGMRDAEDKRRDAVAALEPLDPEAVQALMTRYGFGGIEDPEEREYIARRLDELTASLEDGSSRTVALSMIREEINLFFALDPMVAKLREEIKRSGATGSQKGIEERLTKLTGARANAQAALEKTRASLGMNEAQTGSVRVKAQAQATLSSYIEAVRAYHARGETELIDGIFTAQEVELLTTEYTIRASQYRPDLVAMLNDCLTTKALFDPGYQPPAYARKAVQRLRRGFALGLAEARNEDGEIVAELDEESREEVIDQATREGERGIGTLGLEGVKAQAPAVRPPGRAERGGRRGGRGDELTDF